MKKGVLREVIHPDTQKVVAYGIQQPALVSKSS